MSENAKSFFFYIPFFGHSLAYFRYAAIWMFVSELNSGKEKYIAEGGKVGRKAGWTKSDEAIQEEYAFTIFAQQCCTW